MELFPESMPFAFKCGLCNNKIFYNKQCMIKHIKHVHARIRYPCDSCEKSFSSIDLLNIHARSVHLGLKPYSCLYCNKEFSTNIALHNHIDIQHEFKNEYQCDCCSRIFDQKLPLYSNRVKKVNKKLHKCRFCPKAFYTSRDKQVHLLRHKKARNLVKCKTCDKSFRNKLGLDRHISSYHKKVSCVFCEKIFTGELQLYNHIRLHVNEKAYGCKVCNKEFGTTALRSAHMRTHLQQFGKQINGREIFRIEVGLNNLTLQDFYQNGRRKLHKCKVCKKKFLTQTAKNAHMKLHLPSRYHNTKFDKTNADMEKDSEYGSGVLTRANSCYF